MTRKTGPHNDAVMEQLRESMPALLPVDKATRAERDHAYVRVIEEMRRLGIASYPHHFATVVLGFKHKNALLIYEHTMAAIRAYGAKTSPERMRDGSRGAARTAVAPVAPAALAAERSRADRASSEAARLARELAEVEKTLAEERAARAETEHSLAIARAMVDELGDYLAGRSVPMLHEVETKLHLAVARITAKPVRTTMAPVAADAASQERPRLALVPTPGADVTAGRTRSSRPPGPRGKAGE